MEFDWFAVDALGAIGLFSTGGWGEIPVEVARHAQQHQALAARLALPNWGSLAVWNDFARYGLYVFDWQPYQGPYLQVARPLAEPDSDVRNTIFQVHDLLRLSTSFQATPHVSIDQFKLFSLR
jgi:hypothetical protein